MDDQMRTTILKNVRIRERKYARRDLRVSTFMLGAVSLYFIFWMVLNIIVFNHFSIRGDAYWYVVALYGGMVTIYLSLAIVSFFQAVAAAFIGLIVFVIYNVLLYKFFLEEPINGWVWKLVLGTILGFGLAMALRGQKKLKQLDADALENPL